jgi:amino acid permease
MELLTRDVAANDDSGLRRSLGPVHLTALGVCAVIGAGIFVLTGHAAIHYTGGRAAVLARLLRLNAVVSISRIVVTIVDCGSLTAKGERL